jgi:hypothetical protein
VFQHVEEKIGRMHSGHAFVYHSIRIYHDR